MRTRWCLFSAALLLLVLLVLFFVVVPYVFQRMFPEGVETSDCYDAEFNLQPCRCYENPGDEWCIDWREEMRELCRERPWERPWDCPRITPSTTAQ